MTNSTNGWIRAGEQDKKIRNGEHGVEQTDFKNGDVDHERVPNGTSNGHIAVFTSPEPEVDLDTVSRRKPWDRSREFFLSCIAMSVGLGNVWRFPYKAYTNGGGAFLIPYFIVWALIGRPIYFLELAIGQFHSYGQTKIWNVSPMFRGVGWGSLFGTICCVVTYAGIMGLTAFYFFASMQGTLPWVNCSNETAIAYNSGLFCREEEPTRVFEMVNGTWNYSTTSVSEIYFRQGVLRDLKTIDNGIGLPLWDLTLCLVLAWLAIWGSLIKGVQSAGKVSYFTAIFPYVVLLIMLIRGVTLPGALDGIYYFLYPDWSQMLKPEVWFSAVSQCFFSLSAGMGMGIMFSSHNIYRDALWLSLCDSLTSVLAGIVVSATLGNLAHELKVDVPNVVQAGSGLTFVTFAEALGKFPAAPVFSVLFYIMMFTLGLGSAISAWNAVVTSIHDHIPSRYNIKKEWVATIACFLGFLVGLVFVTPGGQWISDLVQNFGLDFVIYVTAIVEVSAIAYVYGLKNFLNDIYFMLGIRMGIYWKICWAAVTPFGLTTILIYSLINIEPYLYEGQAYPGYVQVIGWMITATALVLLPGMAIHAVITSDGDTLLAKFKAALRPSSQRGPRNPERRRRWLLFKENIAREERN